MNEWDLQKEISKKFRYNDFCFQNSQFKLVCWELMFPSWRINDKNRKWNETSIDFIFYSEEINTFLCVELKNNIKSKKKLISAFCQTTDRAIKFLKEYSTSKIEKAYSECKKFASIERGGQQETFTFSFHETPNLKRVLIANSFPINYKSYIKMLNKFSQEEIINLISQYAENKEFKRFKMIDKVDYDKHIKLDLLTETTKNLT